MSAGDASLRERVRATVAWAATPLALVFVHLALSMYYWLPELGGRALLQPTWELSAVLVLLCLLGLRRWPRGVEVTARVLLTVGAFGFMLLGFAQGFARLEFGYDVVLAIDLKYVPVLFGMMFRADSPARAIFNCLVIAAVVSIAVSGLWLSIRQLQRAAADAARRNRLGAGAGVIVLAAGLILGFNGPLARVANDQIDIALHKQRRVLFVAKQMEHEVATARGGTGFHTGTWRPTVLVFVVESYGAAMIQQPQFADFRTWLAVETSQLGLAGYTVRSRYLTSPVFGGSSWMADATLLCGVKVNNQQRYEALKLAALSCLPEILNKAGYETVFAAGNTTFVDASFRRLFPFTRMLLKDDLKYVGPRFAWSFMPDQFVIDRVDREVMRPRTAASPPLFTLYMLTSSHHPWSRIPPYVDNWDDLGDGKIFEKVTGQEFMGNQFLSGSDYAHGFDASVRYALHTVFEYVRSLPATPAGQDAPIIIILGDHQPRHPIAEMKSDNWWVPLHVISRDPKAVERFASLGYVPGITPDRALGSLPLERFIDQLLLVLGPPRHP